MKDGGEGHVLRQGFVIVGRVQGVGFRWWTRREGARLGARGTVCNLPDGTVSVMAVAPAEVMRELRAALAEGPPLANVIAVEDVEYSGESDPVDFVIDR